MSSENTRIDVLDADSACNTCAAVPNSHQANDDLELDTNSMNSKLNWLRAGVLGANDGIVSTAGLVVGVAGAAMNSTALLISGIAGLAAGALSMAAGEYVSVSTQRDAEEAAIERTKRAIKDSPEESERRLASLIKADGVSKPLAIRVAHELTKTDALGAHARFSLGIDPDELTNPMHAAFASMVSFALGAIIPLLTIVLAPRSIAVALTAVAVTVALAITGSVSAKLGEAPILRATIRNVLWGNIAMFVTYWVGTLVGNVAA